MSMFGHILGLATQVLVLVLDRPVLVLASDLKIRVFELGTCDCDSSTC